MMEQVKDVPARSLAAKRLFALWNGVKWLIMAAALGYLWYAGALSRERLTPSDMTLFALPGALLFLSVNTALISLRFHVLLRALQAPSYLMRQFRLNFSGVLVQQIGSDVSFDAMRIIGAKSMGGTGAAIFTALLVDRLLGVLALSLLAATGLLLFWQGNGYLPAAVLLFAMLAVIPASFVFWHKLSAGGKFPWLLRIPGSHFAAAVGEALLAFRRHYAVLFALLLLSLLAHLAMFTALYYCATALANSAVTAMEALTGGALSSFTTMLPLPMAGLGIGEAAFGEVVSQMRGAGQAADFASIFLVNRFLLLLLGTVSWLWLASAKKR